MVAEPFDLDPRTIDLITPERYERDGYPHDEWTWLRANAPVFWYERPNFDPFWAITKHADIVEIGKRPDDFLIEPRIAIFANNVPVDDQPMRHLMTMDAPDHRKFRNVISKRFTPRMVKQWEPKVRAITRRTLDEASEKPECDFVEDVAAPITIAVIAEMLGLPRADWPLLFRLTNQITTPEDPEFQEGNTALETLDRAREELFRYFQELTAERRKRPTDDLVSAIANAQVDGKPLEPVELLSFYLLLVIAGNETTRNAMTGGMLAFLDAPAEWEKLVEDPTLIDPAMEEIVRWSTPVIQLARTASRDVEIHGQNIREGQSVCLFYASGNRDEEIFSDPFQFRIDRRPNEHVAFGRGEHSCLGAHLARLELRCLFEQFRDRLKAIEAAGPFVRVRSSFVGGIKRAPIRWTLAPAQD
ncbi:MAG: cytochrome P450 [Deltaproteobacteria bacterium]|nr:cytochrome P450 [Deltaproteobacteria bacterium]